MINSKNIQTFDKIPLNNNLLKIKLNNYYKSLLKILLHSKIYVYLFFFLSYWLYYKSLEKCTKGQDMCTRMISWIKVKIIQLIFSCLIMAVLFELIINKIISRMHLIHMILSFILFYSYSHGLNFEDHGLYNFEGYFILFIILFLIFLPINFFIYLIKKQKKVNIIKFIIIFFLTIVLANFFYNKSMPNCNDWPRGLNNTFLDNDSKKYGCKIIIPKICPYQILKNFLDFSKFTGKDCRKMHFDAKRKLLKLTDSPYINDKVNHIGYPLTNKDPSCNKDFIDINNLIKKYFLKNLVDMENKEVLDQYFNNKFPEVEVDFSNNKYGEMKINLNYNKTLSKERTLLERNSSPYSNNILILYIDSVSRVNSLRQLKKTLKFFEKFMNYKGVSKKNNSSEKFHSFQFFKYHSFRYCTTYNFPLLLYGRVRNRNIVKITKYLKENGYITGYSNDACNKDNTRTLHNLTIEEVYDHQFIICDPNTESINLNSIRCLYGKQTIEHLLEYGNQFWRKYKDNRKFFLVVSNDGHEGTLEVVKYDDNIIYNFLNNLFNDNLLNNTSIILLSDHGDKMPSIYYPYDFYRIEGQLPMLYMIINDRKNISYEKQYKYIYKNQQTFITAYDIYNTIGNLIFGDKYYYIKNKTAYHDTPKSQYGKSLFEKINQKKRNPQFYKKIGPMRRDSCKK